MNINNISLRVLIKGKPITEYSHNGLLFVEGRHSSQFEIELTNANPFSVEAIVSVDGLSVIDGKDAGPNSSGYMLKAHETLRIPGWKLDNEAVAAFEFAGKAGSYAAQSTGSARNTGVIGVMAYKEKVKHHVFASGFISPSFSGLVGMATPNGGPNGYISGYVDPFRSSTGLNTTTICTSFTSNCVAKGIDLGWQSLSATQTSAQGMAGPVGSIGPQGAVGCKGPIGLPDSAGATVNFVQANLGTAFGERQDFATETVSFERGDLLAMAVVYYDDAHGLKNRGIILERRVRQNRAETANAFPGMGCTPPAGWRG